MDRHLYHKVIGANSEYRPDATFLRDVPVVLVTYDGAIFFSSRGSEKVRNSYIVYANMFYPASFVHFERRIVDIDKVVTVFAGTFTAIFLSAGGYTFIPFAAQQSSTYTSGLCFLVCFGHWQGFGDIWLLR